jgi:hypothetical protein
MIRNLKVLLVAAMAVAAFGAFAASGAQAAEFHCSVEPCRYTTAPDEAVGTKTAHHVFILTNSVGSSNSITCNQLKGEGTTGTKTATTLTLTNVSYETCTFVGQTTTVKMNGCEYQFTSHGTVGILCPAGKKIEFEVPNCKVEVGAQSPLHEVTYHNIGTTGTTSTKVTVEAHVTNIAATMTGTQAGCGGVDPTKTPVTGNYTTGNTIVSAETDVATPVAAEGWWV